MRESLLLDHLLRGAVDGSNPNKPDSQGGNEVSEGFIYPALGLEIDDDCSEEHDPETRARKKFKFFSHIICRAT